MTEESSFTRGVLFCRPNPSPVVMAVSNGRSRSGPAGEHVFGPQVWGPRPPLCETITPAKMAANFGFIDAATSVVGGRISAASPPATPWVDFDDVCVRATCQALRAIVGKEHLFRHLRILRAHAPSKDGRVARAVIVFVMGLMHMETLLAHLVGDRKWHDFVGKPIGILLGTRDSKSKFATG